MIEQMSYITEVAPESALAISCCILILLGVLFFALMDGARLYSGWPTRGLFFLAAFGIDALICSLMDAGIFSARTPVQTEVFTVCMRLIPLWQPSLITLYYARIMHEKYRSRIHSILFFDLLLSVFLMILFFVLPKERIVMEVYTVFMLVLSVVVVIATLIGWHGGQKGYRRIYWECAGLTFLAGGAVARFAGILRSPAHASLYALSRSLGAALFMLIMTVMQVYAIIMEFRKTVNDAARQQKEYNEDMERAYEATQKARIEAEALKTALPSANSAEAVSGSDREDMPDRDNPAFSASGHAPHVSVPADLPVIEGLDWNYAFLHLPDAELVAEMVRDFYTLLPSQSDKLEEFYHALPDKEAMTGYRIQVHGMKSSAATIGIVPLAGMAAVLEAAAREEREEEIRALHPVFCGLWLSYKEKLIGVFGIGEESETTGKRADPELLISMLNLLKGLMEDMDVDAADETIAELRKYDYDEEDREALDRLSAAVTSLDSDETAAVADAWLLRMGEQTI